MQAPFEPLGSPLYVIHAPAFRFGFVSSLMIDGECRPPPPLSGPRHWPAERYHSFRALSHRDIDPQLLRWRAMACDAVNCESRLLARYLLRTPGYMEAAPSPRPASQQYMNDRRSHSGECRLVGGFACAACMRVDMPTCSECVVRLFVGAHHTRGCNSCCS